MRTKMLIVSLFTFLMVGCAGTPNTSLAMQCENGLNIAYKELDYAKTNGFDGTVEYTKAASLLGAAKIQQQFGKYPNCIDKVERAREYIKASQR
ncbi:hypothetical protein [Thiomicrorhabdus immobilis]|nr:hypothetical protein [Thiomicrorhabdus immobilis]